MTCRWPHSPNRERLGSLVQRAPSRTWEKDDASALYSCFAVCPVVRATLPTAHLCGMLKEEAIWHGRNNMDFHPQILISVSVLNQYVLLSNAFHCSFME